MRITELYSGTGGGHKAVAEAVKGELEKRRQGIEVNLVDGLKYLPWPFSKSDKIYLRVMETRSELNGIGFGLMNNETAYNLVRKWGRLNFGKAKALMAEMGQICITCQPHFNPFMDEFLKEQKKFYVHIVTDLYKVHRFHLSSEVDLLMVPNQEVYQQAVEAGIKAERVKITGIPISDEFEKVGGRVRKQIQKILVMAGGYGLAKVVGVCKEVCRANPGCNVKVVCGHAKTLMEELERLELTNLEIIGFTREVYKLMHEADVLVTKAGGLSISEGLASGLPMVIYAAIAGQEDGNREYIIHQEAGVGEEREEKVGLIIKEWGQQPEKVRQMSQNALRLGKAKAAREAAKEVLESQAQTH